MRKNLAAVTATVVAGSTLLALGTCDRTDPSATLPGRQNYSLTVIPKGAVWKYSNSPNAPESQWPTTAYDDTRWQTGAAPLGHQDPVTTDVGAPNRVVYFRRSFQVADPRPLTGAMLTLRVDDGAVAYLNGREVARVAVPSEAIESGESASGIENWDATPTFRYAVPASALKAGQNVLAIEVHQASGEMRGSTDVTMDASLSVKTATSKAATLAVPQAPGIPTPNTDSSSTTTPDTTMTTRPDHPWTLYWADEFNSSAVDPASWRVHDDAFGDGDPASLHCLTPANVRLARGSLLLTARKQVVSCPGGKTRDYTSGMIDGRGAGRYFPLYGRYEIRARLPHGQGLWPGLWLRHRDGASTAEVDIAEIFHSRMPGQVLQSLHFPKTAGTNVTQKVSDLEPPVPGRGQWHTYAVDIEPETPGSDDAVRFTFRVDGAVTLTYVNTDAASWTGGDQSATWDIAANLFVGGTWVGDPDRDLGYLPANGGLCSLTLTAPELGAPANCPTDGIWFANWNDAVMQIDYVRVYVPSGSGSSQTSGASAATSTSALAGAATGTGSLGVAKPRSSAGAFS